MVDTETRRSGQFIKKYVYERLANTVLRHAALDIARLCNDPREVMYYLKHINRPLPGISTLLISGGNGKYGNSAFRSIQQKVFV